MAVSVEIKKQLGNFTLDVSFEAQNETLALLGASGCGKSMTLRCIAGIVKPDSGRIVVNGTTLFDSQKRINLTPQQRRVGLLFQNYALFPNMTVYENIRTGTRRDKNRTEAKKRVNDIMTAFGISELADHRPAQLSGGQQQRTALARILISRPNLLMLDEPFSALDSHLRFRMEQEVMDVIREFAGTVILVSHDRDEVFRISDKVAVMEQGRIQVYGDKREIFSAPSTLQASVLTGCKNNSRAKFVDKNHVEALDWGIVLDMPAKEGIRFVGIRMHDVRTGEGENSIRCTVAREIENPFDCTIILAPKDSTEDGHIGMTLSKEDWQRIKAENITISLPPDKLLPLYE